MDSENTHSSSPSAKESSVKVTNVKRTINFANVDYSRSQQNGRFYANHVAISSTLFDARVMFSDVDPTQDGSGLMAVSTVTILMSPEIAEILHKGLGRLLEGYRDDYGKSRLPEDAIEVPRGKDQKITPPDE